MKQSSLIFVVTVLQQYSDLAYAAELTIFGGNTTTNESYPLTRPLALLDSKYFNSCLPTIIFAFGFTSSGSDELSQVILKSYLNCENYNVILLNWEKEVASVTDPLRFLSYPGAANNVLKTGTQCGDALNMMSNTTLKNTMDMNTTHLIGHSLGAQMIGYCGHQLQKYNKLVDRITGLDPAGPGFSGWSAELLGTDKDMFLNEKSANIVAALHTDTRFYGTNERCGQVDIWFNHNRLDQPQCTSGSYLELASCDHKASGVYYALAVSESRCVKRETSFMAMPSTCWDAHSSQNIPVEQCETVYVGETMARSAKGDYYLQTSKTYPYGEGKAGCTLQKK